jgi:hypothetical protein
MKATQILNEALSKVKVDLQEWDELPVEDRQILVEARVTLLHAHAYVVNGFMPYTQTPTALPETLFNPLPRFDAAIERLTCTR